MEANDLYTIIHCWWLSLGATYEASVHELANWLNFLHFCVKQRGSFMVHVNISPRNFLWFPIFLLIQNYKSSCNQIPFALYFHHYLHLCCEMIDFVDLQFSFIYINLVMKSGLTFPLTILPKLSITFGYNSWKNATLICI